MTTLRKLELAGGILTAAIGTYVGLTLIYLDYQTSQRHAEPFPIESGVIFFCLFTYFRLWRSSLVRIFMPSYESNSDSFF